MPPCFRRQSVDFKAIAIEETVDFYCFGQDTGVQLPPVRDRTFARFF